MEAVAPPDGMPLGARLRGLGPELGLALLAIASSLLVYLPFRNEMGKVYRLWDGPDYLTVARTFYDVRDDNPLLMYVYQKSYFLRHLPVYPALVRAFSFLGYQRALLLVSIASSVVAVLLFYRLSKNTWKLPSPFFLSVVFLFLPPRWLLYRSAGSTEATYMALTLASIALFERSRVGLSSLLGGLAALTRISGLMMAPAYAVVLLQRKRFRALPWVALVPLPLALFFAWCATRTGNFLEYFAQHSDKMAVFRPFGFLPHFFELGLYHQVEFYILLALVYAVGISRLREFEVLFSYCFFEFILHVFISTEDWSRYWLAMAPFALIIGFHDILTTKAFRWIFPLFALMSYVYAWGALPLNGCRPDIYHHLLYHLGLLSEWVK